MSFLKKLLGKSKKKSEPEVQRPSEDSGIEIDMPKSGITNLETNPEFANQRRDPKKISSVSKTFEIYLDKGKTVDFIFSGLQKKDYTDAEISEGYALYKKERSSTTSSKFFILIALIAIGILGWKYYKANFMKKPEPIQVVEEKVEVPTPTPVPTEIPMLSMLDDIVFDDPVKLKAAAMSALYEEYREEEACVATEAEIQEHVQEHMLKHQAEVDALKNRIQKANREMNVMIDEKKKLDTQKKVSELNFELQAALRKVQPEQLKKDAIQHIATRKFRQQIHKDYGGLVVQSQTDGTVPLGAYVNALKVYKTNGDLLFNDMDFERKFWDLFKPSPRDRIMNLDSYNF